MDHLGSGATTASHPHAASQNAPELPPMRCAPIRTARQSHPPPSQARCHREAAPTPPCQSQKFPTATRLGSSSSTYHQLAPEHRLAPKYRLAEDRRPSQDHGPMYISAPHQHAIQEIPPRQTLTKSASAGQERKLGPGYRHHSSNELRIGKVGIDRASGAQPVPLRQRSATYYLVPMPAPSQRHIALGR